MKNYFITFAIMITTAANLYGQKMSVAVMDLTVTTGLSVGEGKQITRTLLNELTATNAYDVVDIARRDDILKEQGFQLTGACDQGSCLVEVGKLLGVQKIIGGCIGKVGVKYNIALQLVDVRTAKVLMPFTKNYTGDASILLEAMCDAAVSFSNWRPEQSFNQNTTSAHEDTSVTSGLVFVCKNKQGYREFRNIKDGSILIEIPASFHTLGSNAEVDDNPLHTVYLDKYFIGKYEVTIGQYKLFREKTGYIFRNKTIDSYNDEGNNHPVQVPSWHDAKEYCEWAGLTLPSSDEWEAAARGKDGRIYPWGNEWIGSYCNSAEDTKYMTTAPVGHFTKDISPYGCFDMAGNIREWCRDCKDDKMNDVPVTAMMSRGDDRFIKFLFTERGGCIFSDTIMGRSTFKVLVYDVPINTFIYGGGTGFRVVGYR